MAMPVVKNCEFFPSKDYLMNSVTNNLCEHPDNPHGECTLKICPLIRSLKSNEQNSNKNNS